MAAAVGRLSGRVALVTGGGSGIGRAVVKRFTREGALVVIADRDARAAEETRSQVNGYRSAVVIGDVCQRQDCERMAKAPVDMFGRLDILVNNAGVSMPGTVVDMSAADWQQVFDANLTSVFLLCKTAIPAMSKGGGGSIVNTASALGIVVGPGGKAAYSASKAGLIHLTRSLAVDHAASGVRANCVCPGPIESPMFLRNPAELRERLANSRPLRRLGTPDEVADAVLFLASDESSYVTGHALVVDGGGSIV